MALTPSQKNVFNEVAASLRVQNPKWLIDLVNFESGFNPKAKNPFSSARGLIQFIDSTARNLGYKSSLDLVTKHPTLESQLRGPVKEYLKPYAPFNSEHELYMAVFLPAARRYPPDTTFKAIYQDLYPQTWQSKYAAFKKGNPLIETPEDYVNLLKKKPILRVAAKGGVGLITIGAIYLLWRTLRG